MEVDEWMGWEYVTEQEELWWKCAFSTSENLYKTFKMPDLYEMCLGKLTAFRHHEMSVHFEKWICKKPGLIGLVFVGWECHKLFSTIVFPLKPSAPGVLWL